MVGHSCFAGHGRVRFATAYTDIADVVLIGHKGVSAKYIYIYICVCVCGPGYTRTYLKIVLSINTRFTLIGMPRLSDEQFDELPGILCITLGASYGSHPSQYCSIDFEIGAAAVAGSPGHHRGLAMT